MRKQSYTVVALVNNQISVLNRITGAYLKRHINIESLYVAESSTKGISRVIISAITTAQTVKTIVDQLSNNIDIIDVNYYLIDQAKQKELISNLNYLQTTY